VANGSGTGAGAKGGVRLMVVVALVLAGTAAARADLFVRQKITDQSGKALGERVWSLGGGKIRMDEGATGFVLDLRANRGWLYGPELPGCLALPASWGDAASSTTPQAQRIEPVIALLGSGGATLMLRPQTRTIAGHESQRFELVGEDGAVEARWLAPDLPSEELDELATRWLGSPRAALAQQLDAGAAAIGGLGSGFPLRLENLRNGLVFEAVEVRQAALPASSFTPPSGCPGQ